MSSSTLDRLRVANFFRRVGGRARLKDDHPSIDALLVEAIPIGRKGAPMKGRMLRNHLFNILKDCESFSPEYIAAYMGNGNSMELCTRYAAIAPKVCKQIAEQLPERDKESFDQVQSRLSVGRGRGATNSKTLSLDKAELAALLEAHHERIVRDIMELLSERFGGVSEQAQH